MRNIDKLIDPNSYETVLWDAPFNFYYKLDEFSKTLKLIAGIATRRIIIVGSNLYAPGVKGWKRTLYWGAHEANTRIRLVWIYDRVDGNLKDEIPTSLEEIATLEKFPDEPREQIVEPARKSKEEPKP